MTENNFDPYISLVEKDNYNGQSSFIKKINDNILKSNTSKKRQNFVLLVTRHFYFPHAITN